MNMRFFITLSLALVALGAASLHAAGPEISIVSGTRLHPMEKMAVTEVSRQLRELFDASVTTSSHIPSRGNVVVIGTQSSVREVQGRIPGWPRASRQEHFLKSAENDGRTVLMIGGGNPLSTYWAAIEFGHLFGVRRLLHADYPPLKKPDFSLKDIDLRFQPAFRTRAWRLMGDSPAGPASWSLTEHRQRLLQLAKLKFNRIVLPLGASQPFTPQSKDDRLWSHPELRVDGETAGRAAFGRARVFYNPEFKTGTASGSGMLLIRKIIQEAKRLNLEVAVTGVKDDIGISHYYRPTLGEDYASSADNLPTIQVGNREGNVLPLFNLHNDHDAIRELHKGRRQGFVVAGPLIDDLNTSAYFISRFGFDTRMTPARAVDELVTPICGEVSKRIAIGFDHLAKATDLINRNNPTIATPRKDVIMRHYAMNKPAPEWWAEAKNGFIMAMNEMYRANTRARGGARAYSLYLAKKFEFGLHYFTVLESIRAAGMAKAAKDQDAQLENLDQAVEAMHNALSAIADVDRNNGDRGVIALFNEYGFRPLIRELEKADQ